MTEEDRRRFPPIPVRLKDGRTAVVRPLDLGDGEALGEFYEGVPQEDFRFYCPYPLTRMQGRKNAKDASNPLSVVLVLETSRRRIAGYAWYRWKEGASASGLGICVSREFQGSGAGNALMTRLLEIARDVGPPVMTLTVQKANVRAFELYRKMVFAAVREDIRPARPGLEEEPQYHMKRRCR